MQFKEVKHIESNNIRFKYLENQNKVLHRKNDELEKRLNLRIDSLEKDLKVMFKESEANNRQAINELVKSVDKLTQTFNEQLITEKDNRIMEMEKKERAKTTALYSFIVAFLIMVVGTFWDIFIQPIMDSFNKE